MKTTVRQKRYGPLLVEFTRSPARRMHPMLRLYWYRRGRIAWLTVFADTERIY